MWQSGSMPARDRWNRPGRSLRLARSPVAPNRTMTCGVAGVWPLRPGSASSSRSISSPSSASGSDPSSNGPPGCCPSEAMAASLVLPYRPSNRPRGRRSGPPLTGPLGSRPHGDVHLVDRTVRGLRFGRIAGMGASCERAPGPPRGPSSAARPPVRAPRPPTRPPGRRGTPPPGARPGPRPPRAPAPGGSGRPLRRRTGRAGRRHDGVGPDPRCSRRRSLPGPCRRAAVARPGRRHRLRRCTSAGAATAGAHPPPVAPRPRARHRRRPAR